MRDLNIVFNTIFSILLALVCLPVALHLHLAGDTLTGYLVLFSGVMLITALTAESLTTYTGE